jgi:hypothetical protein
MGWKNLKERFRIGHIVQVTDRGICIGSPYIHDIIVVGADGLIRKRYADHNTYAVNEDLLRYQREMDADPKAVRKAIEEPDTFKQSLTVWTYQDGRIVEKQCEEYGWPNLTHDGQIMYENTYSPDRSKVIEWARKNAAAGREWAVEHLEETRQKLKKAEEMLAESDAEIASLAAMG